MFGYQAENGTVFLCNSDGSGDVLITLPDSVEVTVNCADLLGFAAALPKPERISAREVRDILGGRGGA